MGDENLMFKRLVCVSPSLIAGSLQWQGDGAHITPGTCLSLLRSCDQTLEIKSVRNSLLLQQSFVLNEGSNETGEEDSNILVKNSSKLVVGFQIPLDGSTVSNGAVTERAALEGNKIVLESKSSSYTLSISLYMMCNREYWQKLYHF